MKRTKQFYCVEAAIVNQHIVKSGGKTALGK